MSRFQLTDVFIWKKSKTNKYDNKIQMHSRTFATLRWWIVDKPINTDVWLLRKEVKRNIEITKR